MARLGGKGVIVTGAGTGIGAGIAHMAYREGANVLLADIDVDAATGMAETLTGGEGKASVVRLDLGDEASIAAMVDAALSRFGALHAIVNNAADTSLTAHDTGVETIALDIWNRTIAVNLTGTMLACRHAIPALRRSGGGAIVNIASGAALKGSLGLTAYGISKAGIVTLGQYIAAQHGPEGIRCNTIAPGIILTPKTQGVFGREEVWPRLQEHMLSPRLGVPADIAAGVLWLISDEGAYVNGQCLSIDGGQMSHQNSLMASVGRA